MEKTITLSTLLGVNPQRVFTIDHAGEHHPYVDSVLAFLRTASKAAVVSTYEVIDMIEEALYASGDIRYGSKPSVESLYTVRSMVKAYMEEGRPIPILVPWGSTKTKFGSNVDIAEMMSVRQVIDLRNRVKDVYEPGIEVVWRIEDTSGYDLFKLEGSMTDIVSSTELYAGNLRKLIEIMDNCESIWPVMESEMANAAKFSGMATALTPLFESYLYDSDFMLNNGKGTDELLALESLKALKIQGWSGIIPEEQRAHYYRAYSKLYDGDGDLMRKRLAMYFAGSLARHNLNMTGKQDKWDHGFIQLSFVPPITGLPDGYSRNYVYYRAIREAFCRSHMAPWRTKGYLLVTDNGGATKVTPKLTTWHDEKEYIHSEIVLKDGKSSVIVDADYVLKTGKNA